MQGMEEKHMFVTTSLMFFADAAEKRCLNFMDVGFFTQTTVFDMFNSFYFFRCF